jgi:hypothetical protein
MKLKALIEIIDAAYPDGLVGLHYKNPRGKHGDGLARFIAQEIKETFEPAASDTEQLENAIEKMQTAENEISGIIRALNQAILTRRVLPVKIYPGRVMIDGSEIPTADLGDTLREVYRGFRFAVVFVCGFAKDAEVKAARAAFGKSLV